MEPSSDLAYRHYVLAALMIVLGLAAVSGGSSEGLYLVAAGTIIGLLARAVQLSARRTLPLPVPPRWLLFVLLAAAVGALIWAASEWQPRDGELPGRPATLAAR